MALGCAIAAAVRGKYRENSEGAPSGHLYTQILVWIGVYTRAANRAVSPVFAVPLADDEGLERSRRKWVRL